MYMCIFVYICVYIYIYVYVFLIHIYIYIYIYPIACGPPRHHALSSGTVQHTTPKTHDPVQQTVHLVRQANKQKVLAFACRIKFKAKIIATKTTEP